MISHNNNDEEGLDITELPTDQYPVLTEAALAMAQQAAEPNGTAEAPGGTKDAPVRAALSLTHLETEVTRLHSKWQSIDAEFRNREALIAQLHEEIKARETTLADLAAELERGAAAREAADARLASKDAEIAAMLGEQRARDERIEALAKELADAEGRHAEALEKLTRASAETTRLNDAVLREQAAVASLGERNRQASAEQEALQSKLQDLEIYINGRHDQWSELNAELATLRDTARVKEEAIKTRDAIIAGYDEEKRKLTASIHDLERQCSELVGRRKEREEAHDELQKKLASYLAQVEQLKSEYANRAKETEQAVKRALDSQREIESLEHGIKQRDASIEALNARVEEGTLALGELATAKADLRNRVDELEKATAERVNEIQALRDDLRRSHEQLRFTQEELSERTARLAATNQALDRKSREADGLTNELDAARTDLARSRAELATLGAHADELGKLRADAVAEAKHLQAALAARNELVLKLETELRVKQATADLLERSVGRIADLGASLAALDERMHGGAGRPGPHPPAAPAADFAATLAADGDLEAAAREPHAGAAPAPAESDDGARRGPAAVTRRAGVEAPRKLVVTIDGETVDYPISKGQMTIGRGHDSDIRVASHFVSRTHAKLRTSGGATIIEDAGSKNGVLVNSERVLRCVLRDGDVVTLGDDLSMRFVDATH